MIRLEMKNCNMILKYVYDILVTDQNSKPLEIEDKINITLVVN